MIQPPHVFIPTHGGQLREIAARYRVRLEELVDFSANINPAGPPASVFEALQQALAEPATLTTYPDIESTELKDVLAETAKVLPENIAISNGFVPLLEAALRSLTITRCLLPVPSFSEYRRNLQNAGVAIIPYPLSQEDSFLYRPDVLVRALLEHGCDAILLANPQNPSGVLCEPEQMRKLINMAAQYGMIVLLDEAFIDYAPASSMTRAAVEYENLFVFRSLTKFWAIPGLRVAYVVGSTSAMQSLNRSIAPWPVTTLASLAVCAAFKDDTYAETTRRENTRRRVWLEQQLAHLKIATYPSSTNFLLLQFAEHLDIHLLWEKMIAQEGMVLRSCANFEALSGAHLRIAVRSDTENERLVSALERVLSPK
jgi:threonine-phosphate decarboxylase